MNRGLVAAGVLALIVAVGVVQPVAADAPDPEVTAGQAYWGQNQSLEYGWLSGFVPPATTMQPPINRGAEDSDASAAANVPRYSIGTGEGLVAYGKTGTNWSCGATGIACFARSVGNWFHVNFRVHGQVLTNPDGTTFTVRWCDISATPTNCWDVENVALDEFGHVLGLGHHVNPDYTDAVVQAKSRTMNASPNTGWNAHVYGKCDGALLQLRYDTSETTPISDCLITDGDGLNTPLTLTASPPSVSETDPVLFTANLSVATSSTYRLLSGQKLTNRSVSLYRAPQGSSTWTLIGSMTGSAGGIYKRTVTQSAVTYQWQARFAPSAAEGLDASTSTTIVVNVVPCSPVC